MSGNLSPERSEGGTARLAAAELPMIWSSCLAGKWLGGDWPETERRDRLMILLFAVSVLTVAGRRFRDAVGRRSLAGTEPTNRQEAVWLGLSICARWGLYPLASALSPHPALAAAAGEGFLVALYLVGLTVLARTGPSAGRPAPRWPWLLVALPVVVNAALTARFGPGRLVAVVLPAFWLARVAFGRTAPLGVGRVGALRAGTVLVDLSAVAACAAFLPWLGWVAILFVLALALQRVRPAA